MVVRGQDLWYAGYVRRKQSSGARFLAGDGKEVQERNGDQDLK